MRIKHIDALRGIAALSVVIHHLTGATGLSLSTVTTVGHYGFIGVEMFFVISGFILPYSMLKTQYATQHFFTFILKRILRIYPPYLVAILIGIVTTGITVFPLKGILLHLLFLNSAFGYGNIAPVFWTLQIEFIFYLLVGILYTPVFTSNYRTIILIAIMLVFLAFSPNGFWLQWMPFFALGILIFNFRFTNMNGYAFGITAAVITLFNFKIHLLSEAAAGYIAMLFILFIKLENFNKTLTKALLWLGAISYSLYLVHWEIGRAAVAVSRHIPVLGKIETVRVIFGVFISLFSAYILYRLVEKPSIKLANRIKYKSVPPFYALAKKPRF